MACPRGGGGRQEGEVMLSEGRHQEALYRILVRGGRERKHRCNGPAGRLWGRGGKVRWRGFLGCREHAGGGGDHGLA